MANYSSTYGSRSRRAGSGEVARTPATCEDGPSGEVARTPVTCEDGLTSEDFGESSSCNSIVNKSMIAHLISSQLLEHFGENEARNPTPAERTISHRFFRTIQGWIENEFFDSLDIAIEGQMHENELTSAAEDPQFEYDEPPRKKQTGEEVPLEVMTKAVEAYDTARKNKLKAAQVHCRKATHYEVIKRWKKYVEQGGTTQSKVQKIKEYMWSQFRHHRTQLKVTIHDRDLALWAMDKAFEVGIPNFKASSHFIVDFKNKYKITSRRITHLVTKRNLFPEVSLQPIIDEFRDNFQKMVNQRKCQLSCIMNTDQSGFNYEIVSKRTLDIRGSKTVDATVIAKNKTTHSYTIQMTINAAGKFVGPLFIVLQESKGEFGPIVMQKVAKLSTPHLFIRCSTSGKSTKQLTGEYFDKIRESIGGAASILVLDKWSGQTDEGVCIEKFGFNMEPVFLPAGMTKYLQPLDVQFFQDYKYLVKKIVEYSKTHRSICGDIDLTTREAIIQIHHLAFNQFSSPTFDEMRQYAFQKALIKNTDPVYRSVKQVCFHITKDTCANCSTLPFIVCAWCWKHICFKEFYIKKHYHG